MIIHFPYIFTTVLLLNVHNIGPKTPARAPFCKFECLNCCTLLTYFSFISTATSKNLSDIYEVFGKEPYAFSKVEMKDGTVNEIVVYMHFIEVSQNDRVDDSTDDTGLSIEVVILIITNIVTFLISVIGIPVLWFYLKR